MIKIKPLHQNQKKQKFNDESQLGFGKIFTDRMFLAEWKPELGWHNCEIKAYAPFQLDPSAIVFHYGQEIFEGLKAYKWSDGTLALFRPEMNARRFNLSAERLCMPSVPEELFLSAIDLLVDLEREWIPSSPGTSLYIRPTMIAVEGALGVRPANHYYFYVIVCPVGAYYASGYNPIKILVEDYYVRATKGGTGEAKTGGNYASSLKASLEAKKKGFDQVLWLDGTNKEIVEEVGAMNMFFVYDKTIVTAPLEGSILHGITRDSILKVAPTLGYKVEERRLNINTLMEDIASGKVTEAFGSGTAAVVTPVGTIGYKGQSLVINQNRIGVCTQQLYDTLTSIQYGKKSDPFSWMRQVKTSSLKGPLERVLKLESQRLAE
jgi:branched-chain amino acid aminotransferase